MRPCVWRPALHLFVTASRCVRAVFPAGRAPAHGQPRRRTARRRTPRSATAFSHLPSCLRAVRGLLQPGSRRPRGVCVCVWARRLTIPAPRTGRRSPSPPPPPPAAHRHPPHLLRVSRPPLPLRSLGGRAHTAALNLRHVLRAACNVPLMSRHAPQPAVSGSWPLFF